MILLDTSGVLPWIDRWHPTHQRTVEVIEAHPGPFVLTPAVLAELDYMLYARLGAGAQRSFLERVHSGALTLDAFDAGDVGRALAVMRRYSDLEISLADASIVVVAHKYGVRDLLTLDQRDFRVLPGPRGEPFRILPADA